MFGLVLWCDGEARRALIWCEDQGDLAYYEAGTGRSATAPLRVGDLVHVGLSGAGRPRRANSLRLVTRGAHADLPLRLSRAAARQALCIAH